MRTVCIVSVLSFQIQLPTHKSKEWPNFKSPEIPETEDLTKETEKRILRMRMSNGSGIKYLPTRSPDQTAVGNKTLDFTRA